MIPLGQLVPVELATNIALAVAATVTKLPKPIPRDSIRLGLPSKGRMAEDTMQLLKVIAHLASDIARNIASWQCQFYQQWDATLLAIQCMAVINSSSSSSFAGGQRVVVLVEDVVHLTCTGSSSANLRQKQHA